MSHVTTAKLSAHPPTCTPPTNTGRRHWSSSRSDSHLRLCALQVLLGVLAELHPAKPTAANWKRLQLATARGQPTRRPVACLFLVDEREAACAMAAAELAGGRDECGAAQVWNETRFPSFDEDLLRVSVLQVLKQRRWVSGRLDVRVGDLAVQPVCVLAVASREPAGSTARRR